MPGRETRASWPRRAAVASFAALVCVRKSMSTTQPDQNLLFRMRIGAINIAHPPRPGPGAVLASWPHAQDLLDLGPEWRVTDDLVLIPNGAGASHLYGAANGQDRLEVEVFVSAGGFSGAVDRLGGGAAETMVAGPPLRSSPAGVG